MAAKPATARPPSTQAYVGGKTVQFSNLGIPLTIDFLDFYSSYFTHGLFDASNLFNHSFDFMDANYTTHQLVDAYFENFTPVWNDLMSNGKYSDACKVWESFALRIALYWEKDRHKSLHKGTPYYFLGVSKIAMDNLDEGLLLMHQALEEDKRTLGVGHLTAPAYLFVTLDYSRLGQFFYPRVKLASDYLDQHIEAYRKQRGGSLTLDDFKKRFLEEAALAEPVFYFVALLHRLVNFSQVIPKVKDNAIGSLDESGFLFSLSLVIDATLRNKDPNTKHVSLREFLIFLSQNCKPPLFISDADLRQLSADFKNDFQNTVGDILASRYSKSSVKLSYIEEDIALVHGFRNFGAHRIERQPVVVANFDSLLQRLADVLFFAVEQLYR